MSGKPVDRPLYIAMDFGEALARFSQTRADEVEPPPKRKRKAARPKPGAKVKPVSDADEGEA